MNAGENIAIPAPVGSRAKFRCKYELIRGDGYVHVLERFLIELRLPKPCISMQRSIGCLVAAHVHHVALPTTERLQLR